MARFACPPLLLRVTILPCCSSELGDVLKSSQFALSHAIYMNLQTSSILDMLWQHQCVRLLQNRYSPL